MLNILSFDHERLIQILRSEQAGATYRTMLSVRSSAEIEQACTGKAKSEADDVEDSIRPVYFLYVVGNDFGIDSGA